MAEGILRHKAEARGLRMKIDSAGTESIHVGENPDRRATSTAKEHGVDISRLVARQITRNDFDAFDMILVAESHVYNEVIRMARNEGDKKKVDFIMNLMHPDSNKAVPDPYYGGMEGFEKVFCMLDSVCEEILKQVTN